MRFLDDIKVKVESLNPSKEEINAASHRIHDNKEELAVLKEQRRKKLYKKIRRIVEDIRNPEYYPLIDKVQDTLEGYKKDYDKEKENNYFIIPLKNIIQKFRENSDLDNIGVLYRFKGILSMLRNIPDELQKECDVEIEKGEDNDWDIIYAEENIEEILKRATRKICKDFFAATIILYKKNNYQEFVNREIKRKQKKTKIENDIEELSGILTATNTYLNSSDLRPIQIEYTLNNEKKEKKKINPLNIEKIKTYRDYYNQAISLVRMLNLLSPKTVKGGKIINVIAELDKEPTMLLNQAKRKVRDSDDKDSVIDKFNELVDKDQTHAESFYQIQKRLIKERKKRENEGTLDEKIQEDEKLDLVDQLMHWRYNLNELKESEISMKIAEYMLQSENLNMITNAGYKIVRIKRVKKENGFIALNIEVKNDENDKTIEFELQIQSEFARKYSIEENGAHNLGLENKGYDVGERCFKIDEKNERYIEFLRNINSRYYSNKHKELQEYIDYAYQHIQLKDKEELDEFLAAIINLSYGKFGSIAIGHSNEHNNINHLIISEFAETSIIEDLLKGRKGVDMLNKKVIEYVRKNLSDIKKKVEELEKEDKKNRAIREEKIKAEMEGTQALNDGEKPHQSRE